MESSLPADLAGLWRIETCEEWIPPDSVFKVWLIGLAYETFKWCSKPKVVKSDELDPVWVISLDGNMPMVSGRQLRAVVTTRYSMP
jgi:hypothetical protein